MGSQHALQYRAPVRLGAACYFLIHDYSWAFPYPVHVAFRVITVSCSHHCLVTLHHERGQVPAVTSSGVILTVLKFRFLPCLYFLELALTP
jgi:hypothetical protein